MKLAELKLSKTIDILKQRGKIEDSIRTIYKTKRNNKYIEIDFVKNFFHNNLYYAGFNISGNKYAWVDILIIEDKEVYKGVFTKKRDYETIEKINEETFEKIYRLVEPDLRFLDKINLKLLELKYKFFILITAFKKIPTKKLFLKMRLWKTYYKNIYNALNI